MSKAGRPPRPWWLRRWAIAAAILLFIALAATLAIGAYRPFSAASEGMAPTLKKGDRFFASMRGAADLRRGDIVVFATPNGNYVMRVAGLAGDRIGLDRGIVILNGRRVPQRQEGTDKVEIPAGAIGPARRLVERFPGEARPHRIYDAMHGPVDDFPETMVRPGHVFLLGDNRDMSADSRFPVSEVGVDQLPIDRILGKAMFHGFFSSKRIGTPL